MRHSDILQRRYDEVDWDHCRIWINKAKAGEREQPINPTLRDALKRQRDMESDREGWIFPSRTKSAHGPHRVSPMPGKVGREAPVRLAPKNSGKSAA